MENKKITIDDIARELNISKTTVSRAISGKGRIGRETTERVLNYINEMNYRPSAIAKSLAQSRTFNIAFAMPGESKFVDLPYFQKCMWGISSTAAGMDYDVILCMMDENDISGLERVIVNHKVDGVILGRTYENGIAEQYLSEHGIPFVTMGTSSFAEAVQIDNDHVAACRELTVQLLDIGLKRLALIGGNRQHIVNKSRISGFLQAHHDLGIEPDDSIMIVGNSDPAVVAEAVDTIISRGADCVVCTDDSVSNTVLNRLSALQMEIPGDMKVASFYNSSMLDNHRPSITSLEFDAIEAGKLGCEAVIALIDGKNVARRTLLGYRVMLRESTRI